VGNARRDPDLFLDNHPAPVVLDEIQYAPELVAAVKRRVDRGRKPGQYVLTGSQQWSVLRSASESLAGRAVFCDLEGFCLAEIAEATVEPHWLGRYLDDPEGLVADPPERMKPTRTVYEQLWWGFLPEADSLETDWIGEFYRAYLRTYIERDVRLLSDVSDWQQFGRFVQLAAALTAQEVNHSKLGRDIGVSYQTARRWLAMLKATFQWFEAPAYHGSPVKRVSAKPKGYLADTGLACSLQMISTPGTLGGHPLAGALFETAVAAEIRKLAATLSTPPSLYHWRIHGGGEVDLLLERDGRLFPIEVKLTTRPSADDARGILSFRRTYPKQDVAPGLVICPAERFDRLTEGVCALPWDSL
jgi:predicted AAA+ superfamily ATPase